MASSGEGQESDAARIRSSLTDPNAFADIFRRNAGAVYRFISAQVSRSDVEDLVGEVFVAAFRSRRNYDLTYPDARPWLFGIATNVVRHHRRSEGRRLQREIKARSLTVSDGDSADDVATRVSLEEQSSRIAEAMAQIDDGYREVLLLFAGSGLSYEEIALALGIPVGTVRSRLSRGRQQLRELLGAHGQYLDTNENGDETPKPMKGLS